MANCHVSSLEVLGMVQKWKGFGKTHRHSTEYTKKESNKVGRSGNRASLEKILTSNESRVGGTVPRSLKTSRILGFLNHPKAQGAHSGHSIGLIAYINSKAIEPGFPSPF